MNDFLYLLNFVTDKQVKRLFIIIWLLAAFFTVFCQPNTSICPLPTVKPTGIASNAPYLRLDNCNNAFGSVWMQGYPGTNQPASNNSLWFDGQCLWIDGYKTGNPLYCGGATGATGGSSCNNLTCGPVTVCTYDCIGCDSINVFTYPGLVRCQSHPPNCPNSVECSYSRTVTTGIIFSCGPEQSEVVYYCGQGSLRGPTGATGPAGGPIGPTGATGVTGATGITGPTGGGNFWSLTGNAGTDPTINFVGTSDATPVYMGANLSAVVNSNSANSPYIAFQPPNGSTHGVTAISSPDSILNVQQSLTLASNSNSVRIGISNFAADSFYSNVFFGGDSTQFVYDNGVGNSGTVVNISRTKTTFYTPIQIQDGAQGVGKVLTSDSVGNASWKPNTNYLITGSIGGVSSTTTIVTDTPSSAGHYQIGVTMSAAASLYTYQILIHYSDVYYGVTDLTITPNGQTTDVITPGSVVLFSPIDIQVASPEPIKVQIIPTGSIATVGSAYIKYLGY